MRETIDQKARRLVDDGQIVEIPTRTFAARGDRGTYLIVYFKMTDEWHCDCPAEVECAHIRGAKLRVGT